MKEPKELTPEEEELAEEMKQAMQQFGGFGDGEAQPGEPKSLFVARITEEERAAARALDRGIAYAERGSVSTMRMLRREEAVASSSSSTQAAVSVAE